MDSRPFGFTRFLEWILALIAAVDCLGVAVTFGISQIRVSATPGSTPDLGLIWPLPAIYLFEVALIGIIAFIIVAVFPGLSFHERNAYLWISSGVLLAFVILGVFSIGLFLIPATLALLIIALLRDISEKIPLALHITMWVSAALIQGLLVYGVAFSTSF